MKKIKKLFHGKIDDLPVIAEFVLESLERDIKDFSAYSPVFTPEFIVIVRGKVVVCQGAMRAWVFIKELKSTTAKLYGEIAGARVKVNALEGYVKLASNNLDVAPKDMGIHEVRKAINADNAETLPHAIRQLLVSVKRNFAALQAVGLKQCLVDELEAQPAVIDELNLRQNTLESERNRLTEADMHLFNDLWLTIAPIFETGKALYKGVDEAKLKDYTFAELERRLHPHPRKKENEVEV
jgi:hypothetical protein